MKPRGRPNPKADQRLFAATEKFYQAASPRARTITQAEGDAALARAIARPDFIGGPKDKHLAAIAALPDKRWRKGTPRGSSVATPNHLESQVLQEIIAYLESRSDIGGIVRTNSGTSQEKDRFIRFNTCIGKHEGERMTLLDVQCVHKPTGRHIECEVKRELWRYTGRTNEVKQAARIAHLRACKAIAFFATSVIEVQNELRKYL